MTLSKGQIVTETTTSSEEVATLTPEQQKLLEEQIFVHLKPFFFSGKANDLKVSFDILDISDCMGNTNTISYIIDIDNNILDEDMQVIVILKGDSIDEFLITGYKQKTIMIFEGQYVQKYKPEDLQVIRKDNCLAGAYESIEKLFAEFKANTRLGKLL